MIICRILYGHNTSPLQSMQELFVAIDEDGDGTISSQELYSFILMCMRLGRVTPELSSMIGKKFDEAKDGEGKVTSAAMTKLLSAVVHELLDKYDIDGSGQIEVQEFSKLYPVLRLAQE
jgi:Ca2+-binding EF-hand superfamily protein